MEAPKPPRLIKNESIIVQLFVVIVSIIAIAVIVITIMVSLMLFYKSIHYLIDIDHGYYDERKNWLILLIIIIVMPSMLVMFVSIFSSVSFYGRLLSLSLLSFTIVITIYVINHLITINTRFHTDFPQWLISILLLSPVFAILNFGAVMATNQGEFPKLPTFFNRTKQESIILDY